LFIVKHLNQFCQQNYRCDAQFVDFSFDSIHRFSSWRYGIDNIHLVDINSNKPKSLRLNITVDKPIISTIDNYNKSLSSYNYTALLTSCVFFSLFKIRVTRRID